jgi:histone H3/H4
MAEVTEENKKLTIVKKAIGDLVHAKEFNIAAEAYDALDSKVKSIVERAINIAKENSRKTVAKKDIDFL